MSKTTVGDIFRVNGLSETKLIEAIQSGDLDPRNLHFKNRLAVVTILRMNGRRGYEIAAFLKCSVRTVERYIRHLKDEQSYRAKNLTIEKIAGYLMWQADHLIQCALKKDDLALAWTIQSQLVERLQGMGLVFKKPDQVEHNINIEQEEGFKKQNGLFEDYQQRIFGSRSEN